MRLRTLALALALSCGVTGMIQAAPKKTAVRRAKTYKAKKVKKARKFKPAKASKIKPRKAKKFKRASR
jgi:cytochrome c556